ncbi:MAG: 30S ribosomal protein S6 [Candidatus Moranbacteria bacterium]|nr:30S ribosomal protein S6 [Candidatus Moranbacteria bacterium]
MRYELLFLVGTSKETELEKIKKDVYEIIESNGGAFEEKEVIEKRKLAYEVSHETHGSYVARRFNLDESDKMSDINTKLNLYTGVLRFMISKASELPELKTKEERMGIAKEAEEKEAASMAREQKEEAEKKEASEKKEEVQEIKKEKKKKTVAEQEDIDKKIEEILNI